MNSSAPFNEELIRRLPLPLAQLSRRADNAQSALDRHLNAFSLWEAGLKLLGTVAVIGYVERGRADADDAEHLQKLARPSLGHWWELVRRLLPAVAKEGGEAFGPLRELVSNRPRGKFPQAARLDGLLRKELEMEDEGRPAFRFPDLFNHLITYRNKVLAHGAPGGRSEDFHQRMAQALLDGALEVLGQLDFLAGRNLIYVSEIKQTAGLWSLQRLELRGESARRLPALKLPRAAGPHLPDGDRLFLSEPMGSDASAPYAEVPRCSLHPLIVYDTHADEVLFLNGRRGKQQTEYLSYLTGRTSERPDLGIEPRVLLARALGMETDEEPPEEVRTAARELAGGPTAKNKPAQELAAAPTPKNKPAQELAAAPTPKNKPALAATPPSPPEPSRKVSDEPKPGPAVPKPALPEKPRTAATPPRLLAEGQIIRDTYEVERFLGEGAFGEVYRVKHRFLGRQAMKVFKLVGLPLAEAVKMLDEALTLSRMVHPHIIRVFEANTAPMAQGDCCFFTMEYVAGGSLERFWNGYGGFVPVPIAVEIMRQVCSGLAVAHAEQPPIIHRDIKPQNILVGYDAEGIRVRVSDFGLAKRVNPLTLLASSRGTVHFKAPEALQSPGADSCAGDVWAIGSTLYLLLTDRLPYVGPGRSATRTFDEPLVLPSQVNPLVDEALDRILVRTLAVAPEDRYPTAREVLEALKSWKPAAAAPPAPPAAPAPKAALGEQPPEAAEKARARAEEAVRLAKQSGKLAEAIDLLEETLGSHPELQEDFGYQLQLWHRGIVM